MTKGGVAASALLTSLIWGLVTRRGKSDPQPYVPPPEQWTPPPMPPGVVPTAPSVPTEPPKPRATPKTIKLTALHRYKVEADVLPVDGVGLKSAAEKILTALYLDDADLDNYRTVERAGVGEVTRVRFDVNSLINQEIALERQRSIAGVGSVWVISVKDITGQ